MKRGFILLFIYFILILSINLYAENWILSMDANLTLTENAYSDNWNGGETGALSWVTNLNSTAEKQINSKIHNKNTLKLSFGQTHNQNKDTKVWARPVKSTDLIDFETVFQFTLGEYVDPFTSGRLESQFLDASDDSNIRYFNPMTFTEALGVAKNLIKKDKTEWSTRLGAGFRQHLNRNVLDTDNNKSNVTSNDGGLIFTSDFKSPLAQEKILLTNRLTLFQAIFNSKSKELEGLPNADYWKSLDINWENSFTANVTKYIMVNLYIQLLYDKEIAKKTRIKQTLALGLTYKFI